MAFYITGDTHLDENINTRIDYLYNNKLTKDDYFIITGDVGLMWNNTKRCEFWLNWFHEQPFTTLFVDGNHENFTNLESLSVKNWNGGKVHKLTNKVIHLIRGQVFTIDDKRFFTFGGGESLDKLQRSYHVTWWERELPSLKEYSEGLSNLKYYNNKVDYIITHSCSTKVFQMFEKEFNMHPEYTDINVYFDAIECTIDYKLWFFGHYHIDKTIDAKHIALFNNVIKI